MAGSGDQDRAVTLRDELTARGHDVVIGQWPVEQLTTLASVLAPAVLLIDGSLSAQDLHAVAHAVEREPRVTVLIVGELPSELEVLVALASGINGYLPADSDPEAVADTVEALDAGAILVPRGTTLPLVPGARRARRGITVPDPEGRPVELTHREWEVLVLVRQACSTAEIARRLVVARVTVRTHIASLVRKLRVADRAALAAPQIGGDR